jgi:hypothetical protein
MAFPAKARVITMKGKRYKFQALVSLPATMDGEVQPDAGGQTRRVCIRGEHHATGSSRFFNAIVSSDGGQTRWARDNLIMTVTLVSDEPRQYFDVGDKFTFWLGSDLGLGVVTRRLFV